MLTAPINIPSKDVNIQNSIIENNHKNNFNNNYFYYYRNENNNVPPSFSPSTPPEHKIIYKLIQTQYKEHRLNSYYNYSMV